jgi:tight adherence protein C
MESLAVASLAAVAAGCGIAGLATALPRPSFCGGRRTLRVMGAGLWIGAPVVLALMLPAPRFITVPLAILLGIRIRGLLTARKAAQRARAMDAELPQLLDLLAAGSAAGLSAVAGLRRSVSALRGPLGEELRVTLDAVDLGARWRSELADVAERAAVPDLRRAVAVLIRSETLGASLTEATRELAVDVRAVRRANLAEQARTAPVKMLFPLVFLILPAFLLMTVVPVLLTTVRSIR